MLGESTATTYVRTAAVSISTAVSVYLVSPSSKYLNRFAITLAAVPHGEPFGRSWTSGTGSQQNESLSTKEVLSLLPAAVARPEAQTIDLHRVHGGPKTESSAAQVSDRMFFVHVYVYE